MEAVVTLKQVTKTYNQFYADWQQVQNDSAKFTEITGIYCGIINKAPLEQIPFYVDEYYMKVAAVYDSVDTLEFGKMRSATQQNLHKQFISPVVRGAFLASAYEGEKDILLSYCSHEGLKFQLKQMKRELERVSIDHTASDFIVSLEKIDDLDNLIAIASRDINMYRLKIINLSKESLRAALHKSQNRRFCLNAESYYMDGNYGHLEGFKCEYYKKASGKEAKVNYKTLLYSTLEQAHAQGRDLYDEIRNLIVRSAPNFSHDELLIAYQIGLSDTAASTLQLKEQLAAHSAEVKAQRAKSRLILQAREEEKNALTDPEAIRERDVETAAHAALMRSLVGGVRVAGDSSDDDLDSDSDDDKHPRRRLVTRDEDTAPQHPDDMSSVNGEEHTKTNQNKSKRKEPKKISSTDVKTSVNKSSSSHGDADTNVISKKFKRYSMSSKERGNADYSSTDSEATMYNVSPPRPHENVKPHKKKSRGSAFLEQSSSPLVDSTHATSSAQPQCVITSSAQKSIKSSLPISSGSHVSSAPKSMSMLQQMQGSIQADNKNKKQRGLSYHLIDTSVVAEFDPSFPVLDGHPHNDSLLHEIDESLVRLDYSDGDAEMEDEDHHTENVGWNLQRSGSPTSSVTSQHSSTKRKTKRKVDPVKAQKQQAAQDAAAAKKEEKRVEAKTKREEAVFNRRVLEANSGRRNVPASETDEEQSNPSRKRRMTSGISASWTGFYGVNLALNQAQLTNSALIIGCADHVLGGTASSSRDNTVLPRTDADYSVVLSYRKQSGAVCDKVLKQKLMKHLQLDIFKEITFERLITEYSVAKRESVGVADDEIIDIDWFEVMDGFSINLKQRLSANSRIILGRIHIAIDDDNTMTAKFAMKERFTKSMNAFIRHGYRTINSIITKTVHKIGSHFDSLNFSDALPRFETFGRKTQGYAFSFTASLYNVFEENTTSLTTGGDMFGVDPLLCEIMKSSTNESHMADIIEYSLIKKSRYTDSPASYTALHKYLEKRRGTTTVKSAAASSVDVNGAKTNDTTSSLSSHSLPPVSGDNTLTPRAELWTTNNTSTPTVAPLHLSNCVNSDAVSNTEESRSSSLILSVADLSLPHSTITNTKLNKQLFGAADEDYTSKSHNLSHLSNTQEFTNEPPIVIDNADQSVGGNPRAVSLCAQVLTCYRQFLLLFLSDVKHHDDNIFIKLNTRNNIKATRNLSLLKFLEENLQLDDVALYDLFCGSTFVKTLSCVMLIPFQLEDQYNIIGDGYCFYRAIFMLLLREQSGHRLTAEELKEFDELLKQTGENAEKLRSQFQEFYIRIERLFPDPNAKAKVAAAGCTFSNLSTYLDERFWGGSDSVPFLDYSCTAFSCTKEYATHLAGTWAQMYCSSIPGLINGRDSVDYNDVGSAYSLHDVLMVLMRPHNWLLHKQVHFFIADHPPVETYLKSFSTTLSCILTELRLRMTAAKGEDSDVTFTEVYDRMVSGTSTPADVLWLTAAKNFLERQLTEQNFMFGRDEEIVHEPPPTATTKQMETFLATPFGATQEQKIYISTINNTVAVKESENELLRTQLAGLKEMIARNSASVKCPIFIDCDQ